MTQGCIYVQMHFLCHDGHTDVVTTLSTLVAFYVGTRMELEGLSHIVYHNFEVYTLFKSRCISSVNKWQLGWTNERGSNPNNFF
jgi:hypothetical protein